MSEAERRAAERDYLFVRRAALPAPPPPPITAVLARARRDDPVRRPRRVRLWSLLAAAAALVVGVGFTGRDAPAPVDEARRRSSPSRRRRAERCEDPRAIARAAATREEHAYAACLSGTPNCAAMAQEPHEAEGDQEPTCSVTCDACGPHPGEGPRPGDSRRVCPMKKTLVAPVLASLFVLLAGCGHTEVDTGGGGDSARRDPGAQPVAAAKQVVAAPRRSPRSRASSLKPAQKIEAPAAIGAKEAEKTASTATARTALTPRCRRRQRRRRGAETSASGRRRSAAPSGRRSRSSCSPTSSVRFCARAETTMHELAAKYGSRVRIAFKNNPLPFHDAARLASRAALAAGEQGKFWEYHDILFAHQDALGRDALLGYAKDLGLDVVKIPGRDGRGPDRPQRRSTRTSRRRSGSR